MVRALVIPLSGYLNPEDVAVPASGASPKDKSILIASGASGPVLLLPEICRERVSPILLFNRVAPL